MLITWHTRFSFAKTARDLEDEQLKVHVDQAVALLDVLREGGRPAEPAYYMWHKHLSAFMVMGMVFSQELSNTRRFGDRAFWKFERAGTSLREKGRFAYEPPPWFRDADVALSHRSVLVGLSPDTYGTLWPSAPRKMPLLWPVVGDDGALAELRVAKADLPLLKSDELVLPMSVRDRVVLPKPKGSK